MEEHNIYNTDITDEEAYENIKEMHSKYPKTIMDPEEWKEERLKQLKKEGRIWRK